MKTTVVHPGPVLSLLAAAALSSAQLYAEAFNPATPRGSGPAASMHREAIRLIREDSVREIAGADKEAKDGMTPARPPAEKVLTLAPLVIEGRRAEDLSIPPETSFNKFVRTGTVAQHLGRKVDTRFWMRGDSGIMLTFSF
jgi:hypothetical protein